MDLLGDTAAILNSIVSNSYYGMVRGEGRSGQISVYKSLQRQNRSKNTSSTRLKFEKSSYFLRLATCEYETQRPLSAVISTR